jgi:hypothetical protein
MNDKTVVGFVVLQVQNFQLGSDASLSSSRASYVVSILDLLAFAYVDTIPTHRYVDPIPISSFIFHPCCWGHSSFYVRNIYLIRTLARTALWSFHPELVHF